MIINLVIVFIGLYLLDLYSAVTFYQKKPNLFVKLETNTNFVKLLQAYKNPVLASIIYSITYLFQELIITLIAIGISCWAIFGFSTKIFAVWIIFNIVLHFLGIITNMIALTFKKEIK